MIVRWPAWVVAELIPWWIDCPMLLLCAIVMLLLYAGVIPLKHRQGLTYEEWKAKDGRFFVLGAIGLIVLSLYELMQGLSG